MNVANDLEPRAGAAPGEESGPVSCSETRVFFELRKEADLGRLRATVRNDRLHILKDIELIERLDTRVNDIVVDLYINDEYVLSVFEGPETPWFFIREEFEDALQDWGEMRTLVEVLRWLKHPVDELEAELKEYVPKKHGGAGI